MTRKNLSVRALTEGAIFIAMAEILSFLPLYKLPWGGSVTLFSMFCICIIGYFYGIKAGLLSAVAYSILQFFQSSVRILF